MDQLYIQHQGTVRKVAHKFYKFTGIEFDELVAQGNLIFCMAYYDYCPGDCSFNTFLWSRLHAQLSFYCQNRTIELAELDGEAAISYVNDSRGSGYVPDLEFWDIVRASSEDTQRVIGMVFSPIMTKRIRKHREGSAHQWKKKPLSKNQIKNYLITDKRWSRKRVAAVFHEINGILETAVI